MSSSADNSTSVELICLDDSKEECQDENARADNLVGVDTTTVVFDETLPPGVPPEGFVVLDETIESSKEHIQETNNDSNPIFKVIFRDDAAFQNYSRKIDHFLKDLLSHKHRRKDIKSKKGDLTLEIFDSSSKHKHFSNKTDSKEKQSNDSLFIIDNEPKIQDDLDIPMYKQKFDKVLQKSNDENNGEREDCGPKMTCFNCLGNHSLRDCDQPRNYVAINKNRKEHNFKRGSASTRYHLDDDQRFGHFVPGQITPQLREALGLRNDELPRHIYRMRVLGYPPGWLEEARLQHSGLSLIDQNGKIDRGSDEEGEIVLPGDKDQYDIKKIVDFPGFNVLPEEGILDEYAEYWGTPNQEYHSKTAMVSFFSKRKVDDGYKRKKMPNPANMRASTDLNPGEMEVDEVEDTPVECLPVNDLFIPPLPKDEALQFTPPPPPPPLEDSQSQENTPDKSTDEDTTRNDTLSLFDLEFKKRQLLAELNDSNSTLSKGIENSKSEDTVEENSSIIETPTSDISNINDSQSETEDVHIPKDNLNTPLNTPITTVQLGTPILYSASPFKRLPSSEKFSKDICDVINFENLPDSTGKYDQMSELLQKVRTRVSELNKE
ncbi:zinc finger CCHC domain-containing protein 8 homolog [Phymastichus coffea]|uniref:zinc finger CCHC domain-containing protein 8 homolog n=1 Tax=Phymastichus coffea TaxID=108790 RepID=UPI00273CAF73|nr:zinc finger CCHC domain-containing protein 8 homolog [Phymastichus coffea]